MVYQRKAAGASKCRMCFTLSCIKFQNKEFLKSALDAAILNYSDNVGKVGSKESPFRAIMLIPFALNFALTDFLIFIPFYFDSLEFQAQKKAASAMMASSRAKRGNRTQMKAVGTRKAPSRAALGNQAQKKAASTSKAPSMAKVGNRAQKIAVGTRKAPSRATLGNQAQMKAAVTSRAPSRAQRGKALTNAIKRGQEGDAPAMATPAIRKPKHLLMLNQVAVNVRTHLFTVNSESFMTDVAVRDDKSTKFKDYLDYLNNIPGIETQFVWVTEAIDSGLDGIGCDEKSWFMTASDFVTHSQI